MKKTLQNHVLAFIYRVYIRLMSHLIVQVVLDTPLDFCFDYRYPVASEDTQLPQVGQLIVVPFGRRTEVGLVVGIKNHSEVNEKKLKDALSLV